MKTNEPMTPATAQAVLEFCQTAPGVGYSLWNKTGAAKFAELRPTDDGMFTMRFIGLPESLKPPMHRITASHALAVVQESAHFDKNVLLWMCCACGDKETSRALAPNVSHGFRQPCADKIRAEALASMK